MREACGLFRKRAKKELCGKTDSSAHREKVVAAILLAMSAWTLGCGGGGAGSVAPSSASPPSIHNQHYTKFRIGVAGREPLVFCLCLEHNEHVGNLEHQRRRRRLVLNGNNWCKRSLHRPSGLSGGRKRPSNRDKQRGFIRKRNGKRNNHK